MNGRLDWTQLFFASTGRLARGPFMGSAAVLVFLAWLFEAVSSPALRWVAGIVVYPFLLYCGVCILAKRLHDRGRNGWWAAVVLCAIAAVWTPHEIPLQFLFWFVLIWAAVELCAMPGEQGSNRFGPNPLIPAQA